MHFKGILDWEALLKKRGSDPAFKEETDVASKRKVDEPLDFPQKAVGEKLLSGSIVFRDYTFLSHTEVVRMVGTKAASIKDISGKLVKIKHKNEHGQLVDAFIFSDEESYRKIRVFSGVQTETFEEALASSSHAIRSQAHMVS